MRTGSATAAGLVVGYAIDALVGDPKRAHPVAGFGKAASALERVMWRDSRVVGAGYMTACVGAATGLGAGLGALTARRGLARAAVTALVTWTVLGGNGLAAEGTMLARFVDRGDLAGARTRLSHLCARDPRALDEDDLVRAATESIAENASDAVVAPLLYGAIAGVPGLLGYRALNTLDAMVGYRAPRFTRFGWASARADDLANLVPARLCALLAAVAAPAVGGRTSRAWRIWRRDGAGHPSPNAGQVESAFAGALGIRLGGTNRYGDRVEDRGTLGDGRCPTSADLRGAVRLAKLVGLAALGVSAVVAL